MRSDSQNWVATAEYDLETARHMLATGRYLYVVFMCHLALEKLLKAHVTEVTASLPARTHDLIYLVKKAALTPPVEHLEFIGRINNVSVPPRYPDDLRQAIKDFPESVASDYLDGTTQVFRWLREHPNLNPSSNATAASSSG